MAAHAAAKKSNKKIGSQLKQTFFCWLAPFATPNDPKNQNYIAMPFICHLRGCSVTTQS